MKKFIKEYALLIGGLLLLLIVFFEYLKSFFQNSGLFNQGIEYKELSTSGAKLTDTQSRSLAEQLHASMATWLGTDEDTIYRIFTGLSVPDFNKIYNFFGQRPYSEIGGVATTEGMGLNLDLFGWLSYELTESEKKKLYSIAPLIFPVNSLKESSK